MQHKNVYLSSVLLFYNGGNRCTVGDALSAVKFHIHDKLFHITLTNYQGRYFDWIISVRLVNLFDTQSVVSAVDRLETKTNYRIKLTPIKGIF